MGGNRATIYRSYPYEKAKAESKNGQASAIVPVQCYTDEDDGEVRVDMHAEPWRLMQSAF